MLISIWVIRELLSDQACLWCKMRPREDQESNLDVVGQPRAGPPPQPPTCYVEENAFIHILLYKETKLSSAVPNGWLPCTSSAF